jgi:D-xylonolactonase
MSECPIHREYDNKLYFRGLDGEVFRKSYNDKVDDFEVFHLGIGNIGSIVEQEDFLLLFADFGRVYKWTPESEPILLRDYKMTLFNDCFADARGRVICGLLAENYLTDKPVGKTSTLARINFDGTLDVLETLDATTPNGIHFSPDDKTMYFAVTDTGCVFAYDYDIENGSVSNKRVFATNCCPDGITTDMSGNVWVTDCRCGGSLICYNSKGEIVEKYKFPVRRITSVNFGGEDMSELFVTTAHENLPVGSFDGNVFAARTNLKSTKQNKAEIRW